MKDDSVIASDQPLDAAQRAKLAALLDVIVPASDDGRLPSAAEMDLLGYLGTEAAVFAPMLSGILAAFDEAFAERPFAQRLDSVQAFSEAEPQAFEALLFHVYGCYYADDRVLEAIGVGEGPPFPRGNQVQPGDLDLLDPVTKLNKGYRRVT